MLRHRGLEIPAKLHIILFCGPSRPVFCISLSPIVSQPSSLVILSCQSATVPLRPCLRFCQCLHGIAIVFPMFHHRLPVVIRSPDLWLRSGSRSFSLVFRLRYCSVFSVILFPAQPGFLSITVYSYLSISFFALDIRCPCSPTCIFVPRLGLLPSFSSPPSLSLHLD